MALAPMDKQNLAELNILKEIELNGNCSQRDLAHRSGLGLSYLNIYLRGLIRKGYVSVKNMPGRRLWYNLTPTGIAEKARMTLEYMKSSLGTYQDIRARVRDVCQQLKEEGKSNIAICGVSDAAEIFYLGTIEAGLTVTGVVDNNGVGRKWLHFKVLPMNSLAGGISYDAVIIGDIDHCDALARRLADLSIPDETYRVCTGQRIQTVTLVQVVDG